MLTLGQSRTYLLTFKHSLKAIARGIIMRIRKRTPSQPGCIGIIAAAWTPSFVAFAVRHLSCITGEHYSRRWPMSSQAPSIIRALTFDAERITLCCNVIVAFIQTAPTFIFSRSCCIQTHDSVLDGFRDQRVMQKVEHIAVCLQISHG